MGRCTQNRNYMDEMRELICEIDRLKPEPEICNVRCAPFGCPRGPCPGICCYEGICDACCVSEIPCSPPPPHPPRCCAPPCLPFGKTNSQSVKYLPFTSPRTCTANPTCPPRQACPNSRSPHPNQCATKPC